MEILFGVKSKVAANDLNATRAILRTVWLCYGCYFADTSTR